MATTRSVILTTDTKSLYRLIGAIFNSGVFMMQGEFIHIAAQIAERASDGGISVAELNEIASFNHGEVNCYPGDPGNQCHSLSFFVSLHGKLRKGKGHYNFAQILEAFIQNMQGRCVGKTRRAVIMTDAWWHDHYEKWHANIEAIQHGGVHVEVYLIGIGGRVSQVNIGAASLNH